jgi:hypothetical protein
VVSTGLPVVAERTTAVRSADAARTASTFAHHFYISDGGRKTLVPSLVGRPCLPVPAREGFGLNKGSLCLPAGACVHAPKGWLACVSARAVGVSTRLARSTSKVIS